MFYRFPLLLAAMKARENSFPFPSPHFTQVSTEILKLLRKLFLPCYWSFPVSSLFFSTILLGGGEKTENLLLGISSKNRNKTHKNTLKLYNAFLVSFPERASHSRKKNPQKTEKEKINFNSRFNVKTIPLSASTPHFYVIRESNNQWKRCS